MSAPQTGYRPIGLNTGFIFASQTVGSILRAMYAVALARRLGPELFGLMNYGLGWYAAFLAAANLQLESYMSRQVALAPAAISEELSKTMTLRVISTALVYIIASTVAWVTSGDGNLLATVLLIFAAAMAGRSAAMWCNSAFIARESARHIFKADVGFRLLELIIGVAALLMGQGLVAIVLIHALSWWGQATYGFWLVRRHLSTVHFRARCGEQIELFRAVLPIAIASIGATWLMQGPFVLFKDKASAAGDLGVVALVLQIFVLVTGVPVALGRAALPALSRTVARADNKDAVFLSLLLRSAISGTAILIVGAASVGSWAIPLIFGDAYRSAGFYLAYAMLLVLPFGVGSIANQMLIAHDRTWQAMISAAVAAITMTVVVRVFVPTGGSIAEYLLCIFGGMLIWVILALGLLSRRVAVNWSRCLVKPLCASGLSVGLYYILVDVISTSGSFIVAMLVLFAGQIVLNIVDQQERVALSNHVIARLGRSRIGR